MDLEVWVNHQHLPLRLIFHTRSPCLTKALLAAKAKNQERLCAGWLPASQPADQNALTTAQHPSPWREVICQTSICVHKHKHTRCKTPQTNLFLELSQKAPTFVDNCTMYNKKHFCIRTTTTTTTTQNPCTVIPRRALPPFSALLHFSLKLENQKCLNFHRSNHFSQNLLRNKAESSCNLQLRVTQCLARSFTKSTLGTSQIGFGAVLVKARTLYHQ